MRPKPTDPDLPHLISLADAAELAGNSEAWWRKLITRKQIPVVKLGRSVRLRAADVQAILARGFRP